MRKFIIFSIVGLVMTYSIMSIAAKLRVFNSKPKQAELVECGTCNGKGGSDCSSCEGGWINCAGCSGKGIKSDGKRCYQCNGRGLEKCSSHNCRAGWAPCSSCKGTGWIKIWRKQ